MGSQTTTRWAKPTPERLREWLSQTATTSERVHGLLALGLPAAHVAEALGVTVSALRNWSSGQSLPRPDAAIALDDLRYVAWLLLVDGGMECERVARWLTSRDAKSQHRPLDLIRTRPTDVLTAAYALTMPKKLASDNAGGTRDCEWNDPDGETQGDTVDFAAVPA